MNLHQDWKRILPGLVVSLIALAVVFYFADFQQVLKAIQLADYRLVILVSLFTLGWLTVRGIFWRTLLRDKASFKQVFLTTNEGYLINNVLPLRLGEVARAFLLSQKANLGFLEVFSTIIIERALDLVMAAGLLLIAIPFVIKVDWALQAALGIGGIVIFGLIMLFLLARNSQKALRLFEKYTTAWPKLQSIGRVQLSTFLAGLSILTDPKLFARAITWLCINWGIAILQYYALLRAFYPDAKLVWAAFALGVVAIGAAAPSSPGALGVLEAAMVGALAVFGLDASTSLAVALTGHATNYLITGVIGGYALINDGIHLTQVGNFYKKLRDISPEENLK